ncbi:hypothetical protein [Streptomyces sp. NPDC016845]|uniref:hypothetical protein n=1 Tax=Streptomyces sp. NPDC016845 TaxID=3364972 RepID=UPI0037A2DA79
MNGGSSLGLWHERRPAVERGDLTVWIAEDGTGTSARCVGAIPLARSDKATDCHRAEVLMSMVHGAWCTARRV